MTQPAKFADDMELPEIPDEEPSGALGQAVRARLESRQILTPKASSESQTHLKGRAWPSTKAPAVSPH